MYKAKYAKLVKLVDNTSQSYLQLANPSNSLIIDMSLRNSLQTLLYTSWLEKNNQTEIIIGDNRKIDINESSTVIYWAVLNKIQPTPSFHEFQAVDFILLLHIWPILINIH